MPKPKQLTPDDIKSGIYTLSYMEETLGGSRLTWAKFIKTYTDVFLLREENKTLKKFKTDFRIKKNPISINFKKT